MGEKCWFQWQANAAASDIALLGAEVTLTRRQSANQAHQNYPCKPEKSPRRGNSADSWNASPQRTPEMGERGAAVMWNPCICARPNKPIPKEHIRQPSRQNSRCSRFHTKRTQINEGTCPVSLTFNTLFRYSIRQRPACCQRCGIWRRLPFCVARHAKLALRQRHQGKKLHIQFPGKN